MAIITEVKPDPRHPGIRQVMSGQDCIACIRVKDVTALPVAEGTELNEHVRAALVVSDRITALWLRALRSQARTPASRQRLAGRLARHAHTPEDLEHVLDDLATEGLIDDQRMALAIAEELLRRGPAAPSRLRAALRTRGFTEHDIEAAVERALSGHDLEEDARQAAAGFWRDLHHLAPATALRRLGGRLARRGFSEETIADILTEYADTE